LASLAQQFGQHLQVLKEVVRRPQDPSTFYGPQQLLQDALGNARQVYIQIMQLQQYP
jgi:hypothetical protein